MNKLTKLVSQYKWQRSGLATKTDFRSTGSRPAIGEKLCDWTNIERKLKLKNKVNKFLKNVKQKEIWLQEKKLSKSIFFPLSENF